MLQFGIIDHGEGGSLLYGLNCIFVSIKVFAPQRKKNTSGANLSRIGAYGRVFGKLLIELLWEIVHGRHLFIQ
jgi:hypothetical protein